MLSPLLAHARAVREEGLRLGLVAPGDVRHIVARHSADSLLFARVRAPGADERWADVGSGAGFPGLVLACCYPETRFTLIEPMRRRAGFLDLQVASLGLANVEVVQRRAEQVAERFDVVLTRAFAEPSEALRRLAGLVAPAGAAIVAAGSAAAVPADAREVRVEVEGVESPGRFFVLEVTE